MAEYPDGPQFDPITKPAHYNQHNHEVIDVIEDWDLPYFAGNAVKYLGRYRYKGNPIQDLEKARFYIDREIQRLQRLES